MGTLTFPCVCDDNCLYCLFNWWLRYYYWVDAAERVRLQYAQLPMTAICPASNVCNMPSFQCLQYAQLPMSAICPASNVCNMPSFQWLQYAQLPMTAICPASNGCNMPSFKCLQYAQLQMSAIRPASNDCNMPIFQWLQYAQLPMAAICPASNVCNMLHSTIACNFMHSLKIKTWSIKNIFIEENETACLLQLVQQGSLVFLNETFSSTS